MEFSILPIAPQLANIFEVFTIAKNVLKAAPASAPSFRQRRQEHREQPDRRQERADLIDERDASVVGDLAENGSAPRIENQITYLRLKLSPSGPPKKAPTAMAARKMKR